MPSFVAVVVVVVVVVWQVIAVAFALAAAAAEAYDLSPCPPSSRGIGKRECGAGEGYGGKRNTRQKDR